MNVAKGGRREMEMEIGIEDGFIPTQPAKSSVTVPAVTLTTLSSTERMGWQRFTPPKVASVSDVPVQLPLLK
jgi:hypothetical protein